MLKIQMHKSLSLLRSRIIPPLSQIQTQTQISPFKTPNALFSHTPFLCRNQTEDDNNREGPPKLLVVQPRIKPITLMQAKLSEALNLANSLEQQQQQQPDGYFTTELSHKKVPPHVVVQNPLASSNKGRADTFFGPGTVDNVKCHINAVESQQGELDAVFVNAILSAIQQRNLERVWGKPVLDRVGLIIEIFHAHAFTKEAKLQAELAALMYKKSRLVRVRSQDGRYTFGATGEAEVVSARGRGGSGGRGFISGAGETELELQRRRISERRKRLVSEIGEVRRTRAVQRAARRKQGASDTLGLATVAVVGYTNAGKSTLVSALSHSDLYSDDRLFATVDPRVRGVTLPSGRKILLSDTVGFISDLPVQLVEAFHATLEEVVEADLLVHVLDSSATNLEEHRKAVLDVLRQIGVSEKKIQDMIEVWNKIDVQKFGEGENVEDDNDGEIGDEQEVEEDVMENKAGEDSDVWLEAAIDNESESEGEEWAHSSMGSGDENKAPIHVGRGEDDESKAEHLACVKTSAVTRVGLKELLDLIDEKLINIEKERKQSQRVVERNIYDRKWRPARPQDTAAAVER